MQKALKYFIRLLSGQFYFNWKKRPDGVYCFTYHRIGQATETEFDANVYSCTSEQFENHLCAIKKNFEVISTDQLLKIRTQSKPLTKRYAIITFDDGYLDNFEIALPLLKKHDLTATFFVTTDFISQKSIPWWDEIAWMIKQTKAKSLTVGANDQTTFSLQTDNQNQLTHLVLSAVKKDKIRTIEEKINAIRQQLNCQYVIEKSSTPLFMNWSQVEKMQQQGMTIGAHTVSHPILAHLDKPQQTHELATSKNIIEAHIKQQVTSFAYPVGGYNCYNDITKEILSELGFQQSFVYESGINLSLNENTRFEILRIPVEENKSFHRLQYAMAFPQNINH